MGRQSRGVPTRQPPLGERPLVAAEVRARGDEPGRHEDYNRARVAAIPAARQLLPGVPLPYRRSRKDAPPRTLPSRPVRSSNSQPAKHCPGGSSADVLGMRRGTKYRTHAHVLPDEHRLPFGGSLDSSDHHLGPPHRRIAVAVIAAIECATTSRRTDPRGRLALGRGEVSGAAARRVGRSRRRGRSAATPRR